MHQKQRDLQKRFKGFLQTPNLWKENAVRDIHQFELSNTISKIDIIIDEKQRLGKYVEQFVFYQLKQEGFAILLENVQIQKNKQTLGELDCIIKRQNSITHLELVYKFYLYDDTIESTEIECFIGPNRKDSLTEKLQKLKEKQLPLLYSTECKKQLSDYKINSNTLTQKVCFKAQLFVPYQNKVVLNYLNQDCVKGFYINKNQLKEFEKYKFYIPCKKDWLLQPEVNVNWLNYVDFQKFAKKYYHEKYSPLLWIKHNNGELSKCFLVWW